MKLTYRGIDYDYNPPMLEVTESEIACRYRGNSARYTYVRHVPIPQLSGRMTYRGAAYQATRQGSIEQLEGDRFAGQAEVAGNKASARRSRLSLLRDKLVGVSPAAQARRELLQEASFRHKQSISRSLQHRIEVAKAEGNDLLLHQLESEMRQSV